MTLNSCLSEFFSAAVNISKDWIFIPSQFIHNTPNWRNCFAHYDGIIFIEKLILNKLFECEVGKYFLRFCCSSFTEIGIGAWNSCLEALLKQGLSELTFLERDFAISSHKEIWFEQEITIRCSQLAKVKAITSHRSTYRITDITADIQLSCFYCHCSIELVPYQRSGTGIEADIRHAGWAD